MGGTVGPPPTSGTDGTTINSCENSFSHYAPLLSSFLSLSITRMAYRRRKYRNRRPRRKYGYRKSKYASRARTRTKIRRTFAAAQHGPKFTPQAMPPLGSRKRSYQKAFGQAVSAAKRFHGSPIGKSIEYAALQGLNNMLSKNAEVKYTEFTTRTPLPGGYVAFDNVWRNFPTSSLQATDMQKQTADQWWKHVKNGAGECVKQSATLLNLVPQGDEQHQRIGDTIRCNGFDIECIFRLRSTAAEDRIYRGAMYLVTQPIPFDQTYEYDYYPQQDTIFRSPEELSGFGLQRGSKFDFDTQDIYERIGKRWKILWGNKFALSKDRNYLQKPGNFLNYSDSMGEFRLKKNLPMSILTRFTGAGVATNPSHIATNPIYFLLIHDQNVEETGFIDFMMDLRLYYVDN